ncbi:hypothetical protein RhiirA4_480923 [Rhizophagus irregularis]|uniref:F-box domain-containing protein n=1 Tax=Rhizophagus irregularis TaxID=588596 RepID=A0A2I1HIP4_9GLOM|nr:hypothetical protein RhiirA4_480923 [Rhizophagus irregularis]
MGIEQTTELENKNNDIIPINIYDEVMPYYLVEKSKLYIYDSKIIKQGFVNVITNYIDKKASEDSTVYIRTEDVPIYKFELIYRANWDSFGDIGDIKRVQILWEKPYEFLLNHRSLKKAYHIRNYEILQFIKFYNTIIDLLPTSSKQLLIENNVISISTPFLNKPLFNYISFSSEISPNLINEMGLGLIEESICSNEYQEKYKILEQEYYKLFINNCKNITNFRWNTSLPLYQYPGASTCFSQLRTLGITCNQSLISDKLLGMAQICQDIENLELWYYDRDAPGLIKFIDNQKNLQSLHLHNSIKGERKSIQLSETIEKKAVTLKRFSLENVLLSLKFLPSLINLEQLKLRFENYCYLSEKDWKKKLDICLNFEEDDGDDHERETICDEVLNYLLNYSPRNFDEFAFNENWRFSVNNLKNFFEGWRSRKPIKFITRFDRCYHFTKEHVEIVQKYYDEGVIDKNTSFLYGVNDY